MKHKTTKSARTTYLAHEFDKLDDQDQAYLETLTARLAAIQETAPEKRSSSGKNPESVVQQYKEQDT